MALEQYVPLAYVSFITATQSVTLSNISQEYRDLLMVINAGNSATTGFLGVFNGDGTSSYSFTYAGANGSNFGSGTNGSYTAANFAPNSWSEGGLSLNYSINIMDYSATNKHKAFLSRCDAREGTATTSINTGLWASTAGITSIQVKGLGSSNFTVGSTIALYGVR